MVCAANMTHLDEITTKQQQQQDSDDFDMAIEDDDSEEDSSQDEEMHTSSIDLACQNKHPPATQALFLNFTSDLSLKKKNKKKNKPKKQTAYRVNGVNILNRNDLDSKTAIERIQRRRENHNHVERRRRDNINNTIFELSSVVPNATQPGQKPNKGNILRLSLDYIKDLQAENRMLKERLYKLEKNASPSFLPTKIGTTKESIINTVSIGALGHPIANFNISPSAPNSPNNRFNMLGNDNTSNIVPLTLFPQSQSVPTSPSIKDQQQHHHHHLHYPTPLSLPPPQQQLQMVFSAMSVSSNTTSPVLAPAAMNHPSSVALPQAINSNPNYFTTTTNNNPDTYPTSTFCIPQPPQLNKDISISYQQPTNSTTSGNINIKPHNFRPLLPADNKNHTTNQSPVMIQQQSQTFLPSIRMSGYEKIYGNVCRY